MGEAECSRMLRQIRRMPGPGRRTPEWRESASWVPVTAATHGWRLDRDDAVACIMRLLLLLLLTAWAASPASDPAIFDVILRHGTILDGSGRKPYRADVAIVRGY